MAVILPMSRSLAKQLLARSARSLTRPVSSNPLLRVNCACGHDNDQSSYSSKSTNLGQLFKQSRSYATGTAKPASRPKQHTGRTPAKRTPKAKPTKKATPTKKPTTKKVTKKVVVKKATPRAKKQPSKHALLKKARKERADLKATALLQEPKRLPATPYQLILVEETKGTKATATAGATAAANKYKNLALADREQYNHDANQNKAKNDVAYKKWVQSHSALEIRKANNARRQLTRKSKAAGKKKTFKPIHDDRAVRQASTSYTYFSTERNHSGDLNGMTIGERGKLVGQEWNALSAAQKKPYEDSAKADMNRYLEEFKSVYGEDPISVRNKAKA